MCRKLLILAIFAVIGLALCRPGKKREKIHIEQIEEDADASEIPPPPSVLRDKFHVKLWTRTGYSDKDGSGVVIEGSPNTFAASNRENRFEEPATHVGPQKVETPVKSEEVAAA